MREQFQGAINRKLTDDYMKKKKKWVNFEEATMKEVQVLRKETRESGMTTYPKRHVKIREKC